MKFQSMEDYEYEPVKSNKIKEPIKKYEIQDDSLKSEAETLANSDCDYKNVFGYVALDKKNGKKTFIKYNKDTELFVAYYMKNGHPVILTTFYRTYRSFNSKMYDPAEKYEYVDEIRSR